jgi:hypothetical protein
MLLNINVFNANMVRFGCEEEQQNPDLSQFTDAETKPPAKHVKKNKLNSLSNNLKKSYKEVNN